MRRSGSLALTVWLLACGTASAAIQKAPDPKTPPPPAVVKSIDRQILADQDKLSKSYPAATLIKLAAIARQLLSKLDTLPPGTTPRAWIEREVRTAFPGAAVQSDLDAMAFWVSLEVNEGLEQHFNQLLSQQKLAQKRQEQVAELLARTHRRLGTAVPRSPAAGPPKPGDVPAKSPLNTRLALRRIPDVPITERDIDKASSRELADLQKRLTGISDDTELAHLALQDLMQRQQTAIHMMSSIMKQLHDTAQCVISTLKS